MNFCFNAQTENCASDGLINNALVGAKVFVSIHHPVISIHINFNNCRNQPVKSVPVYP